MDTPPPPRLHPRPHLRLVRPGAPAGDEPGRGGRRAGGGRDRIGDDLDDLDDDHGGDVIDAAFRGDGEGDAPDDAPPASRLQPRFVVVVLVALQAMGVLEYGSRYLALAAGGGLYAAAAALSLPAVAALYAGALLLLVRPGRGRALFFVAAVGLGLSVPFWGVDAGWTWPAAFGATIALAGAWYARAEVHVPEEEQAQP